MLRDRLKLDHGTGNDVELLGHSKSAFAIHFGTLGDFFPWHGARSVTVKELLLDTEHAQRISPYCICAQTGSVVLVELPSAASYTEPGALFFETQRRRAIRVFCVPFERIVRLAEDLAPRVDFCRLLMVFNTGRCGSNLLSAALSEYQGVCSISEPDVFAPLYVPVPPEADVGSPGAAAQLVWAATVLLLHWAQSATPGFRLLAVKARSRLAGDMSRAIRALPGSRAAMMYRAFLPTIASMATAFRPWAFPPRWDVTLLAAACALGLDPLLYAVLRLLGAPRWRELAEMPVVAAATPPVPPRALWACGHLAVHAVKVLNSLAQARLAHKHGLIRFCITYESLVRHRGDYLQQILVACEPARGASGEGQQEAQDAFLLRPGATLDAVFSEDQHKGRLASANGGSSMWRMIAAGRAWRHGLSPVMESRLEALRRCLQPGQEDADAPLPGTLVPV